jgi:2'-5' RNA ligase
VARAPLPDTARLFVALELPARVRTRLVEWRSAAIGDRDDLRLVASDSLHVTLAFLGSRPVEEVEAIGDAVSEAVRGLPAARLQATGVKGVPRRRPRLFAVDLADPDGRAAAVQAAVADALEAGGWYSPERRRFWPHVTVARVTRAERNAAPITVPPPSEPFTARDVTLYRSHLGRGPARYEALARARLSPRS